jgi:hypothetical protein
MTEQEAATEEYYVTKMVYLDDLVDGINDERFLLLIAYAEENYREQNGFVGESRGDA